MKRSSQVMLTKGFVVLFTLGVTLILYSAIPGYYSALQVQAQVQQQQPPPPPPPLPRIGIKITSPSTGQQIPVGELIISGTSTDNATTDCKVYVDWNDQKPFQNATATGLGGENDYSNWTFTYTKDYHLITNGTNELTSKLICYDTFTDSTKWNSVNITGVVRAENQTQQPLIVDNITSSGNGPVKVASSPLKPQAEPPSVPERASQLVPNKEPKEEDEREEDTLDEVNEEVVVATAEEEDEREEDTLDEVSSADPFKLPF
jgi:hypothetical protein